MIAWWRERASRLAWERLLPSELGVSSEHVEGPGQYGEPMVSRAPAFVSPLLFPGAARNDERFGWCALRAPGAHRVDRWRGPNLVRGLRRPSRGRPRRGRNGLAFAGPA